MSKKFSIYLFNQENLHGKMFNLTEEEIEQYQKDGWLDSPATLDIPESQDTGISKEELDNARPEDLINIVKSYGFIVITAEQLKAEANKMASVVLDISKFGDDEIIVEAERRGLKEISEEEPLINRFIKSPKSLTKKELITLGDSYELNLRMNYTEQTMIDRIVEAIEENQGE